MKKILRDESKLLVSVGIFIFFVIFLISFNIAYKNSPVEFCNNTEQKDDCIIKLVYELEDYNLCEKSIDVNFCYLLAARKFENEKLCEFTNQTDNCLTDIARIKDDYYICENINDNKVRDKCLFEIAYSSSNINICDNTKDVDSCKYSYVINKKDNTLCLQTGKYEKLCLKELDK